MTTHTRVHTYITFANPYLVCDLCRRPVPRWHNTDTCGCEGTFWNDPCGHTAEAVSICPSWSPVDGCQCKEHGLPECHACGDTGACNGGPCAHPAALLEGAQ